MKFFFVILIGIGVGVPVLLVSYFPNSPAMGPISGAIIASAIAIGNSEYSKKKEMNAQQKALCISLVAELSQIKDAIVYQQEKLFSLRNKGEILYFVEIAEDYFTVFSQSAGNLGLFPLCTAEQIIKAYSKAKIAFDSIRLYSRQSRELVDVMRMVGLTPSATKESDHYIKEEKIKDRKKRYFYRKNYV
jgi:hypothetical protein